MKLASDKGIAPGRDYKVIVMVYNPSLFDEGFVYTWKLESFATDDGHPDYALDESDVEGFAINRVLGTFAYRNEDASGQMVRNGRTEVLGLFFQFDFPVRVDPGHYIVLEAPRGFDLLDPYSQAQDQKCKGFKFDPPGSTYIGPASTVKCQDNFMIFNITDVAIQKERKIKFLINTENPATTPYIFFNYWKISHFSADPGALTMLKKKPGQWTMRTPGPHYPNTDPTKLIVSSAVQPSWMILPQLENVGVSLVGMYKRAGSRSEVEVTFRAVSNANELSIEAVTPMGFDFTGCTISTSGQEIREIDGHIIRLRVAIIAGQPTLVRITDMKLADSGGQTEWSITTYQDANKRDEKLSFKDGFRLPGIATSKKAPYLYSEYQKSPEKYPVQSQYSIQMGTTG